MSRQQLHAAVVAHLLTRSGLCDCRAHSWFGDQWSALAVLVVLVVWGAVPFAALSIYAGLLTVAIIATRSWNLPSSL